jgi:hypothetical protein
MSKSAFIVRQAWPEQKPPLRGTMHFEPAFRPQFRRQFVNREIGPSRNPALHPVLDAGQLATPGIALRLWRKSCGLALESHHVVDGLDRNAQPLRRLGVHGALFDERHGALMQLNRMRLTHP